MSFCRTIQFVSCITFYHSFHSQGEGNFHFALSRPDLEFGTVLLSFLFSFLSILISSLPMIFNTSTLLIPSTNYHSVLLHTIHLIRIPRIWMRTSTISPISLNWFVLIPIPILPSPINIVSLNILDFWMLLRFTPESHLESSSDINSILFKLILLIQEPDSSNSIPLFVPSVEVSSPLLLFFNLLLNILFLIPNLISCLLLLFLSIHSSILMDKKVFPSLSISYLDHSCLSTPRTLTPKRRSSLFETNSIFVFISFHIITYSLELIKLTQHSTKSFMISQNNHNEVFISILHSIKGTVVDATLLSTLYSKSQSTSNQYDDDFIHIYSAFHTPLLHYDSVTRHFSLYSHSIHSHT